MDLVLIRHPAVAVDAGVCYGRTDVPLAGDARASSDAVFARLTELAVAPPRAVWTSPLRRCASVAAWLGRRCGCAVTADARLREMDFGAWERMRWDVIDRAAIDAWAADFLHARVHGGESVAQFAARVAAWFDAWRGVSAGWAGAVALSPASGLCPSPPSSPSPPSPRSAVSPLAGGASRAPGLSESSIGRAAPASSVCASGPSMQTAFISSVSTQADSISIASVPTAYVVTHAGVMRVLAALTVGTSVEEVQSWPLEVAAIVWLRHEAASGAWRLVRWNA